MRVQKIRYRLNLKEDSEPGQKLRFAVTGVLNTLVSYLVFVLLYQLTGHYIAASVLAYITGMAVSFVLNRKFVFHASAQQGQLPGFCLVNGVALICSSLTLHWQVQWVQIPVYLAQIVAVGVSMCINFWGYRMVFTGKKPVSEMISLWWKGQQSPDCLLLFRWLILAMMIIVSVLNVHESTLENVAHDALPYMDHYVGKFTSEGRWLNFFLFDFLRHIQPVLAVWLCTIFVGIFGYQVARSMKQEPWIALCFSLVMVNIPYFTMLFKWPMTLLPGTFLLAVFAGLKDRYTPAFLLITSGIVFFAAYPAFYFLMPLLFIHRLSKGSYQTLIRFLVIWMLGYVIGYVIAQSSVYLYTLLWHGAPQWIEFAQWRKSTPTTDLISLWDNINKSAGNFERNVLFLAQLSPWFFVPIAGVTVWALLKHTKYSLVVLMVIFSLYASVITLGVKVPLRSGITLPAGMLMMALLVSHPWERVVLMISLFIPFAWQMHDYNHEYNEKRIIVADILQANDPQGYLKQSDRFHQIVISLDEAGCSRYFYELTHSKAFKNISYLRSHYIQPYLFQFGWRQADMKVNKIKSDVIRGEARVRVEGDTVYLLLH